jgi:hypothetical protein
MNRAAQAASGQPSGVDVGELAGFPCKRSYLVSTFYAMVARRHFKAWGHGRRNHLQDITGEPVSGRFEVSEGLITATLPDGRKTTADIEESMLSPEILARVLLLQMHRAKQPNATSEDLLGD